MFGSAGFLLKDFDDEYPSLLKREFNVLRAKFGLKIMPYSNWKFLRLRPSNFPTIRIAQLAKIIEKNGSMFSRIRDSENVEDVIELFDVEINPYWDDHFQFDKVSSINMKKTLGRTAVDSIMINAVIPMLFYYGYYHSAESYKEKAMKYLEQIQPENNILIRQFANSGIKLDNAFQTQGALYMYKHYCRRRRCLECRIYCLLSRRCIE